MVGLVKLEAALEYGDQLLRRVIVMVPKNVIIDDLLASVHSAVPDSAEVEDVVLAVVDHLLSDFNKQAGHSVVGVVVPGDGVDHFDAIHQSRQCVLYGVGGTVVEWLDELLKGGKILHVIFSFVQCLGNTELDAAPL